MEIVLEQLRWVHNVVSCTDLLFLGAVQMGRGMLYRGRTQEGSNNE